MSCFSLKNVSKLFNIHSASFPVVYLFKLCTVGETREQSMTVFRVSSCVSSDALVCKYGYTGDFRRRMEEHERDYGRIPGVNTEMMMYSYVDPTLVSSAEKDIRNFFKSMGMCLPVDKRREIVVIEKGDVKVVENKFKSVHLLYSGRGGRTS